MGQQHAVNDMVKHSALDRFSKPGGTELDPLRSVRPDTSALITMARHMRFARMRHAKFFPKEVFRDSAWDMMLDLFVLAGEGTQAIGVKQLTLLSGESTTGAIRRIDRLEEAGLIRRRPHPDDHRRVFVELTVHGHLAMTSLMRDLLSMFPLDLANREATAEPVPFKPMKKG